MDGSHVMVDLVTELQAENLTLGDTVTELEFELTLMREFMSCRSTDGVLTELAVYEKNREWLIMTRHLWEAS